MQDPLAEDYLSLSPYNYVSNNPIIFIDANGMSLTDFVDENDKLIKHIDDGSNAVFKLTGNSKSNQYFKFIGFNNQGENFKNIVNVGSAIEGAQEYVHKNFTSVPNYKKDEQGDDILDENGNSEIDSWTTYCNYATSFIAKTAFSADPSLDISALWEGTAKTMGDNLEKSLNVDNVSPSGAEKAAKNGDLAVGYSEGHIFTLRKDGLVNNVGSKRLLNSTFPTSYKKDETRWFVIKNRPAITILNLNNNENK